MKLLISNIIYLVLPMAAFAATKETPLMVNPSLGSRTGAPASGVLTRGGGESLTLTIRNSCFGTNLRSVTNPLAPTSIIHADLTIKMGNKDVPIKVKYPAEIVTPGGLVATKPGPMDPSTYTLPPKSSAYIQGNTLVVKIPSDYKVSVSPDGTITESGTLNSGAVKLTKYSFVQEVTDCSGPGVYGAYGHSKTKPAYPCGAYMGKNGPLSANISGVSVSNNNANVDIHASFPGQTGFCGGYYSPLMLFFGNQRPNFEAAVKFPVGPTEYSHWPSGGTPSALLVIDRNGDGKITERNELFGDQEQLINGFEMLKLFDENTDGKIDAKDPAYQDLKLWFDNGDGVSNEAELVPLKDRVKSISLKYKMKVRSIDAFGEEREWAEFVTNKGEKRKIIDVWFAPHVKAE